jgi:hypothetical protein
MESRISSRRREWGEPSKATQGLSKILSPLINI